MLRASLIYLALLIIIFLLPAGAGGQSIRERTNHAYAALSRATGPQKTLLLNELAHLRLYDTIERARFLSKEAIAYAQNINDRKGLSDALVVLGRFLSNQGKSDSANLCFFQAQKLKMEIHDYSGLEYSYYFHGMKARAKTKVQEAIINFRLAIRYADFNRNYPLSGRCYAEIGNCYRTLNRNTEMAEAYRKADESLHRGGDSLLLSNAFSHMGVIYNDLGKFEKSVQAHMSALRIAEKIGDSLTIGYALSNLAELFGLISPGSKKEEYNRKALLVFRNTRNKRGMAYSLNNLGSLSMDKKKYSEALNYYREAGRLKEEVMDWQGACFVYNNIADLYIRMKTADSALRYLDKADFFGRKASDKLCETVCYNTRGQYYAATGNQPLARKLFEKSLHLAEELELHEFITSNLNAISTSYQAEGKPGEALAYYKKYMSTRDSVARTEDRKTIAELQVKYETEKKESQLNELTKQLMNGATRNRAFIIGNVVVGLLILVIFMVFLTRLKNKIIASEVETCKDTSVTIGEGKSIMDQADQASKSILSQDQQDEIWTELNLLMEKKKLYLKNNLTLSELSRKLNTNTSYLSKVINEKSKENFCNYLNQLRIREARRLLADPANQHLTIEGIAITVGFKSKSTFNTAFKKYTSQTPSEYMNEVSRKSKGELEFKRA